MSRTAAASGSSSPPRVAARLPQPPRTSWFPALVMVLTGSLTVAWQQFLILSDRQLAGNFLSNGLWEALLHRFGTRSSGFSDQWQIPFVSILMVVCGIAVFTWLSGAALIARRRGWSLSTAAAAWGFRGWLWWLLPMVGEGVRVAADLLGQPGFAAVFDGTLSLWWSLLVAGWLATGWILASPINEPNLTLAGQSSEAESDSFRIPRTVWFAVLLYTICFTALNWGLYSALMLPHGDSAMYEEHLWNLLHGKGFRSYLDNGRLFLGEHIQVIHVLLIPLYVLWPSQLLLELCQSAGLAAGAIPIYWIARRHSGSSRAGVALACAYLLYFPMQFLDISIDYKTFRPSAFEIPLLLFALDVLERQRYRSFLIFLVFMVLCQEDAATIIAPLGVWIFLRQPSLIATSQPERWRLRCLGAGLAILGTAYVIFVIKVALPFFRHGQDVHFASYFDQFGGSTGEIVRTLAGNPLLLLHEWMGSGTWLCLIALLVPLAGLPLLSPGRLLVAAPLFGVLCLNKLTRSPLHHFHAPLIPILFWAAAAGLGVAPLFWNWLTQLRDRLSRFSSQSSKNGTEHTQQRLTKDSFLPTGRLLPMRPPVDQGIPAVKSQASLKPHRTNQSPATLFAAQLALLTALLSGIWSSLGPAGINFWDTYSTGYWRHKYAAGERSAKFAEVMAQISPTNRVASTDFVHPRFTHFERSYDYSDYRKVVPDDTDFIVVDVHGPYSKTRSPEDIKEFRDEPDKWELLPDRTAGYFIVLKRKRP